MTSFMGSSTKLIRRKSQTRRAADKEEEEEEECSNPKMPGSMNSSRYWMGLSMAMNALLLLNLLYEKGLQHPQWVMSCMPSNLRWFWGNIHGDRALLLHSNAGRNQQQNIYWSSQEASAKQVQINGGFCKEHAGCTTGHNCSCFSGRTINLDHGDPTMFEGFWIRHGQASTTVILGWQLMSYFADVGNICWFLEPSLANEIRDLHTLVGNAVTEGRYIVVGTGSTQLFQAALFALSPSDQKKPTKVISAAPYYSSYPVVTDYLKSEVYRWWGDASKFQQTDDHYIEIVTSPNNPDGFIRKAVVNGSGSVIYDYAYYWPQYTPITGPADEDVMLFTVSKSTGHAGSRIGWAIVKDATTAKRMTKFIELNTIGVSKDSQLRAAQILRSVSNSYASSDPKVEAAQGIHADEEQRFFHYGYSLLAERWSRLRHLVKVNPRFSLPSFESAYCNFFGRRTTPQPAFAWLKCEGSGDDEEDCENFLRSNSILTRSGRHFGASQSYVRLSIIDRNLTFDLLIERLLSLH